jgi:26S proteasome regulatory subunit N2
VFFSTQPTGGVVVVIDTKPTDSRDIIELKASKEVKQAAAPETLEDRINAAYASARGQQQPHTPGARTAEPAATIAGTGAAAAAGVLTAVDEDEEGAEEAPVPSEFDYYSDGEGGPEE